MRVAILGTGLIGGSVGLALKANVAGAEVVAYDRDPAAGARAVERGAADAAAASMQEAVAGSDVIFIATPVGTISEIARDISPALSPGMVVTDVGSTKSRVVLEVEASIPDGVSFVGGHPMAGTEDAGIEAAAADLFEGAWWILTPTERSEPAAYQTLHGLLSALGARVMAVRPDEHDEMLAVISHIPQLTATTLMNLAAERGQDHAGLLALAAGGFRDMTRVASSNPEIWVDVCRENSAAIADALEALSDRLLDLRDRVSSGDLDAVRDALEKGRSARRSLPGKAIEGEPFDVRIAVPDRPGLLAEVTTTVGNLGINIEDLQITHATEGGRGTLHLLVVGAEQAKTVEEALRALGLDARSSPA